MLDIRINFLKFSLFFFFFCYSFGIDTFVDNEKIDSQEYKKALSGNIGSIRYIVNRSKTSADEMLTEYLTSLIINSYLNLKKTILSEAISKNEYNSIVISCKTGISEYSTYQSRYDLIKFYRENKDRYGKDTLFGKPFFSEIFNEKTLGYVEASSSLNKKRYEPFNVYDGDDTTAWVAGGKCGGIGQWIKVYLQSYWPEKNIYKIIMLKNGYTKNKKIFMKNNRVKKMLLELSSGDYKLVELRDSMEWQEINIKEQQVDWVKLTILETYPGTKYNDTCLSEINFKWN